MSLLGRVAYSYDFHVAGCATIVFLLLYGFTSRYNYCKSIRRSDSC